MNTDISHRWKGVLVVVVFVVLGPAVLAFGTATDSQDITLSATVREPSGTTGTVEFTFALEELPAAPAVMHNHSSVPPQPSAIPEPSTLVLLGLGVLGLAGLRKSLEKR